MQAMPLSLLLLFYVVITLTISSFTRVVLSIFFVLIYSAFIYAFVILV